jgi:hypothetical protein
VWLRLVGHVEEKECIYVEYRMCHPRYSFLIRLGEGRRSLWRGNSLAIGCDITGC